MPVVLQRSSDPKPRGNRFAIYGVLALVLLGFLCANLYFILPQRALDSSGIRTTGTLTYLYEGDRGKIYVDYRYQVGNQTFNKTCNVRNGDFHRDQIGGPITVTYLPDRPEVSRTEPSNSAFSAYFGFWLGIIGIVVCVVTIGIDETKRRADNRPSQLP